MLFLQSVGAKIHSQRVLLSQVMVHITDENDCSPEFQHSIYSRDNVPETIPVGTSLLQGEDHPVTFHFSLATDLLVCYLFVFWPWGSALFHRHCLCKMGMAAFLAICGWLLGILEVELWVSSDEDHCTVPKEWSCGIQGQLKQLIGRALVDCHSLFPLNVVF